MKRGDSSVIGILT